MCACVLVHLCARVVCGGLGSGGGGVIDMQLRFEGSGEVARIDYWQCVRRLNPEYNNPFKICPHWRTHKQAAVLYVNLLIWLVYYTSTWHRI